MAILAKAYQSMHFRCVQIYRFMYGALTTLCIQDLFDSQEYAILQCIPISSSEQHNSEDLHDGLALSQLAQYFVASMYKQTEACGYVSLPSKDFQSDVLLLYLLTQCL